MDNHTCCLDPNAPIFLTEEVILLYTPKIVKELWEAITNYDKEYPEAIRFVERLRCGDKYVRGGSDETT